MQTELLTCGECQRPFMTHEASCPFCAAPSQLGSKLATAGKVFMGVMTPVVLAACYGGAGWDFDTGVGGNPDADGDGWLASADCDDTNDQINPDIPEDCGDAIDNDCDGLIDADDADCAEGGGD